MGLKGGEVYEGVGLEERSVLLRKVAIGTRCCYSGSDDRYL